VVTVANTSFNPNLQREYPQSIDAPFRIAETFGPQPYAHNHLDQVRMNWRRTPEATYPDGYLGTLNTRRGDRLLDGLKARTTSKPYTRGVHKGERLDQRDYFWPDEFHPLSGIEMQAIGLRWAPPGVGEYLPDERYPADSRTVGPRRVPIGSRYLHGGGPTAEQDQDRRRVLQSQAPGWASGGARGNPGMVVHTRGGMG
jgi:hypothetical protein